MNITWLLAPKELYTWYCPMTIRPLFENTPVLDNNLNINALMTLTMMNKITRNVKWHKISNGTKCQMTQNVKWHKVSNDTKCQMTQNIKWHKMSNDTKFQMTRNDTWHMTYDTWQMTNETWQMTHDKWHMKLNFKLHITHMSHMIWHMTHDTWHMRYDVWCMTHDAWWSMTPDRNTRRHTLRSVHSSPGRSFLLLLLSLLFFRKSNAHAHTLNWCAVALDRGKKCDGPTDRQTRCF